jgi:hypothetical protein
LNFVKEKKDLILAHYLFNHLLLAFIPFFCFLFVPAFYPYSFCWVGNFTFLFICHKKISGLKNKSGKSKKNTYLPWFDWGRLKHTFFVKKPYILRCKKILFVWKFIFIEMFLEMFKHKFFSTFALISVNHPKHVKIYFHKSTDIFNENKLQKKNHIEIWHGSY